MYCKRCGTLISEDNLYKKEPGQDIYRCPGCTKPVIVINDTVQPIASN